MKTVSKRDERENIATSQSIIILFCLSHALGLGMDVV